MTASEGLRELRENSLGGGERTKKQWTNQAKRGGAKKEGAPKERRTLRGGKRRGAYREKEDIQVTGNKSTKH